MRQLVGDGDLHVLEEVESLPLWAARPEGLPRIEEPLGSMGGILLLVGIHLTEQEDKHSSMTSSRFLLRPGCVSLLFPLPGFSCRYSCGLLSVSERELHGCSKPRCVNSSLISNGCLSVDLS